MDLSRCTPGQRETVVSLDAPLMVAAGAGSGKTFTLTQRIVHAFSPGSGAGGGAFVSSIDEVVAITFTRKAAAELRSRIKALLAAEGFAEQALAVDDGWVTTIHGMASRILRENALELGIDPAFEVVSESMSDELRRRAVDEVLVDAASQQDDVLLGFLASEALFGAGEHGRGLVDDAQALIARAASMPAGLDGVTVPTARMSPMRIIARLSDMGEEFLSRASEWDKPGKNEQAIVEAMQQAVEGAAAWVARPDAEAGIEDAAFDAEAFRAALYAFPFSGSTAPTKKNRSEFFDEYNRIYAELAEEAEAGMGACRACALLSFARKLDARYDELLGADRFDQAGLLRRCVRALEEHPGIAARYRERFKLIMVDEFQDTDSLQVRLIGLLAQEGLANVCVVGDAQQSIYRFRGADVNVFFDYERDLANGSDRARFPKLTDNFRSHRDVLGFVDAIFSQSTAFGERFLRLEAKGRVNSEDDPLFVPASSGSDEELCRVTIEAIGYDPRVRNETKVTSAEALAVTAERVADHFARLQERGAETKDMALLLGGMGSADVFAAALRRRGIDSVITGGSVFTGTRPARLVAALLRYAVNREDGAALFEALTSPLFAISDDCLLRVSTRYDESGAIHYADLSRGLARAADEEGSVGLSENDARALAAAIAALRRFASRVAEGTDGCAGAALRALLVESGALDRAQHVGTEGLAWAGNMQKACSIVESLEERSGGIASLSHAYAEHLRTAKEAPGLLSTGATEPLRIMTIHSSKGLQFGHVAVAEAGDGRESARSLFVENVGERTFLSYSAPVSTPAAFSNVRGKLRKLLAEEDERWVDAAAIRAALSADGGALSAGEARSALSAWAKEQASAEARRLLYVALTRAVSSVYLAVRTSAKPDDDYAAAGIYGQVHTAFPWDGAAARSRSRIDFGGSMPADVRYEKLVGPLDAAEADGAAERDAEGERAAASFVIPVRERMPRPRMTPHGFGRENVRSYSSLDHETTFVADASFDDRGNERPVAANEEPVATVLDEEQRECMLLAHGTDEDATALGTAFHRLAQRSIASARRAGAPFYLLPPDAEAIGAQERAQGLSEGQAVRLREALRRWYGSALAQEFAAHERIAAEVPFMVRIERDGREPLYLEGEIDGLADDGAGRALLVDYKTGGAPEETPEQLHAKHLQQAQCYAYALMREGYVAVEARFVRVEQADAGRMGEPEVVEYSFSMDDLPALEAAIIAAADRSEEVRAWS